MERKLKELKDWPEQEEIITNNFLDTLRKIDTKDKELPLTAASIDEAYYELVNKIIGIPPEITKKEKFAIVSYTSLGKDIYPQSLMLNSFYLEDLLKSNTLLKKNQAPEILLKYFRCYTTY